jgi:hypothetical protein
MFFPNAADLEMSLLPVEVVVKVPIRKIPVVLDMKDPLSPEIALDDFRKLFGKDPEQNRFRVLNIEVITSPDDLQPMLVSECGRYARFLRRESDHVYFRKALD